MITEDKVIEIFCMADDFCKFFDAMMAKYTIRLVHKKVSSFLHYVQASYADNDSLSDSGYRCLKNFYLEKVLPVHLRNLFRKWFLTIAS